MSYLIYDDGRIYSLLTHRFLALCTDKDGYLKVPLMTKDNKRCSYRVATLVAFHFVGSPPKSMIDPTIDHKDGNKQNNYRKNLRWLERGDNAKCRKKKGIGSQNPAAILNEENVVEICNLLSNTPMSLQQIANKYNVHKSTISKIKRKKNWRHITNKYDFVQQNPGNGGGVN